jgi:hypothetical protein
MEVLIGFMTVLNNLIMKTFYYFFYVYFAMAARTYPGESDYSYGSAICGGVYFSIFLSCNIMTILISLGCDKIIKMASDNFGLVRFFPILLLPFVSIYFLCIHKKKYVEIRECFSYMDRSLKKRLLAILPVFLYTVGSVILFGWSCVHFLK